jgi:tetratricopeptide (TPR) repeat protein
VSDDWKKALSDDRDRAMSLWEQELRDDAAALYADVVARWPRQNLHYPLVVGEYACVLSELGRGEEALAQYQAALEGELAQGGTNDYAGVALARLQVGTQALKLGNPTLARASVGPSLGKASSLEGLLRCVEAEAQWALGTFDEARDSARRAVAAAATEEQATGLRETLAQILGSEGDVGASG